MGFITDSLNRANAAYSNFSSSMGSIGDVNSTLDAGNDELKLMNSMNKDSEQKDLANKMEQLRDSEVKGAIGALDTSVSQ